MFYSTTYLGLALVEAGIGMFDCLVGASVGVTKVSSSTLNIVKGRKMSHKFIEKASSNRGKYYYNNTSF